MGFIYALRSEQEKTKHTSFWAIHFCVPVMGALLFLAYYSLYASTADSKKLKMILEITTTFFPLLISVIVGLNVALEEKASHFQTLLAVPNRHKNMLAKLTYLYGSGVFALFFLFLLFVIGIKIDLSAKELRVDNTPVALTKSEYLICEYLARNKGQVFSKEQIYEAVFSLEGDSDNSTISTHIKNIRSKLNKLDIQPIATVWGIGYKWE